MRHQKNHNLLAEHGSRKSRFEMLESRRLLAAAIGEQSVSLSTINTYGMALFGSDWQSDVGLQDTQVQQHISNDSWRSMLNESQAATIQQIRNNAPYLGAETLQAQVDQALASANLSSIDVRELDWLQERLPGPAAWADYFADGEVAESLGAEGETQPDERPFAYIKYSENDAEHTAFEGMLTSYEAAQTQNGQYHLIIGIGEVPEGSITVQWQATSGTATADVDFTPTSGSVTFTETSEGEKTSIIQIINETQDELDERFTIALTSSASSNYRIDPERNDVRVKIPANDLHVSIFDAPPVTEGDVSFVVPPAWLPMARFRMTISSPRPEPVSIPWRYAPAIPFSSDHIAQRYSDIYVGEGIAGVDGYIVFNPGETEKFLDIPIVGDELYELTEYFYIDIAGEQLNPLEFIVDRQRALGTILDNDPYPELSIDDVEVEEDAGTATLTVTMTGRSSFPVTFDWTVEDVEAIHPNDFNRSELSGTVTIPAGGGPGPHLESFSFEIINDFITEPEEAFRLTLSNATRASITDGTGIVKILANDPKVDIRVDSNNDGSITEADDPIEENAPGKVVLINGDDDNGNGVLDYLEIGPLSSPDDDLVPVNLAFIQAGMPQDELARLRVVLTFSGVRVWDTSTKKQQIPSERVWAANQVPPTLFIEGVGGGAATLALKLHRLEGDLATIIVPSFDLTNLVHFDSVVVTVSGVGLTGHTPYTEPFRLRPIAEANEENPGVHIRRNGDDDNGNGVPDRNDTNVENENDLILVAIDNGIGATEGIRFELERGSNDIRVWTTPNKGTRFFAANNLGPIALNSILSCVWVEWVTPGTGEATSSLELRLIDTTNNIVIGTDTLVFHPFTAVVIVLGGEDQEPADPADPATQLGNLGTFRSAIDLYIENYDVHMYNEDLVGWEVPTMESIPYREVVNAVQSRGVTNVALYGYSHGVGSTLWLAGTLNLNVLGTLTDITQPFTVPFTAYIDAITEDRFGAENRRPPLSQFHVNQYQRNFFGSNGIIGGPSDGDDDLNRTNLNVDHYTIDDHNSVLDFLKMRFRQRVSR
ncbi:MAG: hypothetical protein KF752_19375 [Pirellulaceae bacterium]|nr:hypothetical protein [Pirellulaceae bacterium]